MLEINMNDVLNVISMCAPYLITLSVIVVAAVIVIIACKKRKRM